MIKLWIDNLFNQLQQYDNSNSSNKVSKDFWVNWIKFKSNRLNLNVI